MKSKSNRSESLAKSNNPFTRMWKHDNTPILLVLILVIVAVVLIELALRGEVRFLRGMNVSNVLLQVSVTGIFALSMTLVIISGGIDLSIGWMMAFLGSGMAYIIKILEWSNLAVVVIGVSAAIICQIIMGFIISRTKLEPFIVSLGFMSMYQGFTYLITNGREITIKDKFSFLGSELFKWGDFSFRVPIVVFVVLIFIVWLVMKYTKFGRRVYAVGGNENAAYLAGINVKNFKLLIYGINGLFIAIASMTMLSRIHTGNPTMGLGKEIDVIAAVVVGGTALSGGKGNVWGTVVGVLLLGIMSNALNILRVSPYYQYIMTGLLIVVSVMISYYSGLRTSRKSKKTT